MQGGMRCVQRGERRWMQGWHRRRLSVPAAISAASAHHVAAQLGGGVLVATHKAAKHLRSGTSERAGGDGRRQVPAAVAAATLHRCSPCRAAIGRAIGLVVRLSRCGGCRQQAGPRQTLLLLTRVTIVP